MNTSGTTETERFHRQVLRYAITGLAAVLGSGVFLALVQANVQEWAKANTQDQYLVKYARPIVDRLIELTQSSAFFAIAWAVIGAAAILWIDYAIRQRTKRMAIALYVMALVLFGLATWILYQPSAKVAQTTVLAPTGPIILSPEDRRFREDLRKFAVSNVSDLNQRFGYFTGGAVNDLTNSIRDGKLAAPDRARIEAAQALYARASIPFNQRFKPLIDAASKSAENIDIDDLGSKLKAYFDDYQEAKLTFWNFLRVSGIDSTNADLFEDWRKADERAWNAFKDVKSYPDKAQLLERWINEGFFEARSGWLKQRIRELQSQVEALKGQQAMALGAAPPSAGPAQQQAEASLPIYLVQPKKIVTFSGDVPDKVAAIDALVLIETSLNNTAIRGMRLAEVWQTKVRADKKSYIKDLNDYQKEVRAAFSQISQVASDPRYIKFRDIAELRKDDRGDKLNKALADFREAISNVGDPPTGNYEFFINPKYEALGNIIGEIGASVNQRQEMLLKWRGEIVETVNAK